ncbi:hypothetical protein E5161_13140 [Cohnella pontilimi]|uniref:SCP domain-containing protein n=2 Tax=Cohnella pontilimi TaxID=2564100 RepID=A0A4U0FAC2_9BACL|nr:CAP domain-containing protein [Cohnella pontilimi]TJY41591.1 hypothetical protein E5161_13140 [Cohnella pontilimi]
MTKMLMAGVLGLAISIPVGSASAAASGTVYNISQGGALSALQLNTLLAANTPVQGSTANFASEVVKLVNKERAKRGLKALKTNTKAASVAMVKAKDMSNRQYFSHTSPTYGSPFAMMKRFGITYHFAGENIAMGQRSPAQVMQDWMNSKGHRANILNKNYTSIGVAYYKGEWVQHFLG